MTMAMSAAIAASKPHFLIGMVRGLARTLPPRGDWRSSLRRSHLFRIRHIPLPWRVIATPILPLGARSLIPALVATFFRRSLTCFALSIPGDDPPRYRTIAERGRHKQRVDAGAAGDDDVDVLRPVGDADMVSDRRPRRTSARDGGGAPRRCVWRIASREYGRVRRRRFGCLSCRCRRATSLPHVPG